MASANFAKKHFAVFDQTYNAGWYFAIEVSIWHIYIYIYKSIDSQNNCVKQAKDPVLQVLTQSRSPGKISKMVYNRCARCNPCNLN